MSRDARMITIVFLITPSSSRSYLWRRLSASGCGSELRAEASQPQPPRPVPGSAGFPCRARATISGGGGSRAVASSSKPPASRRVLFPGERVSRAARARHVLWRQDSRAGARSAPPAAPPEFPQRLGGISRRSQAGIRGAPATEVWKSLGAPRRRRAACRLCSVGFPSRDLARTDSFYVCTLLARNNSVIRKICTPHARQRMTAAPTH